MVGSADGKVSVKVMMKLAASQILEVVARQELSLAVHSNTY